MSRKISESELLSDIRAVADVVDGVPTKSDYKRHGEFSFTPIYSRFDSWIAAREKAGVEGKPAAWNKLDGEELLNGLQSFADELGRTPRRQEMESDGPYSGTAYRTEFGSWNKALREAGLEVVHPWNKEKPEHECDYCGDPYEEHWSQRQGQKHGFCSERCNNKWLSENRVGADHPQYQKITFECDYCGAEQTRAPCFVHEDQLNFCNPECMGQYRSENWIGKNSSFWEGGTETVHCSNCGNDKEVKPAVAEMYEKHFCDPECHGKWKSMHQTGENNPNWAGGGDPYYGPNWQEQRHHALERDDHMCQGCGTTQEEHINEYGISLHVHHIMPLREFTNGDEPDYEAANDLENLVTYCFQCHHEWEGVPLRPVPD